MDPHLPEGSFCLSQSPSLPQGTKDAGAARCSSFQATSTGCLHRGEPGLDPSRRPSDCAGLSRAGLCQPRPGHPFLAQHQSPSCTPMLPTMWGGFFLYCLPHEEGSTAPPHPPYGDSSVPMCTGPSLGVRVLEAPGLHSGNEEVLRAEGLVVESVAVAGAAPVQVPVDVERLAAPSTCGMLQSVAAPLCSTAPRGSLRAPGSPSQKGRVPQASRPSPARDFSKTTGLAFGPPGQGPRRAPSRPRSHSPRLSSSACLSREAPATTSHRSPRLCAQGQTGAQTGVQRGAHLR